jgi:hypothetical protein
MSASARKNPNQTHPVINANVVENVGPDEVLIRLILDAEVQDGLELTQLDLSDCLDHFSARKNVRYAILSTDKQAAGTWVPAAFRIINHYSMKAKTILKC